MYNYSFVIVYKGKKRSIINYVYINVFKDLFFVVLLYVCFGICFLIYFVWYLYLWKKKKNIFVVLVKWYILFCGSRELRELVLGIWVCFLLLFIFLK